MSHITTPSLRCKRQKGEGRGGRGRERGKLGARETRGARERGSACSQRIVYFVSANIHDSLPVKCQPMKILLTFSLEPGAGEQMSG